VYIHQVRKKTLFLA